MGLQGLGNSPGLTVHPWRRGGDEVTRIDPMRLLGQKQVPVVVNRDDDNGNDSLEMAGSKQIIRNSREHTQVCTHVLQKCMNEKMVQL